MDFAGTPEEKKVIIIKDPKDYIQYVPGQPKPPIVAERVAPCHVAPKIGKK
jgi:hypothetical protein